jgi:hypothetical protein
VYNLVTDPTVKQPNTLRLKEVEFIHSTFSQQWNCAPKVIPDKLQIKTSTQTNYSAENKFEGMENRQFVSPA